MLGVVATGVGAGAAFVTGAGAGFVMTAGAGVGTMVSVPESATGSAFEGEPEAVAAVGATTGSSAYGTGSTRLPLSFLPSSVR